MVKSPPHEAGKSPGMIFKHYRELVQPKEAKASFAIAPKGASARNSKAICFQ